MKRAGKCAGKRKYPYRTGAIDMAHWKYLNEGILLGVYECPTCLDFHLTSKYCNLRHLHKGWRATKDTWVVSKEQIKRLRKNQLKRLNKKAKKVTPNPTKRAEKVAKQFYKKSILPISEQKRITAGINPQPKSFWRRIFGIITVGRG